jgi:hypothetical protein
MIKWSDFTFPPINLYTIASLTPDFEAKIEKKEEKVVVSRPDFSILYKKRNEG